LASFKLDGTQLREKSVYEDGFNVVADGRIRKCGARELPVNIDLLNIEY